MRKMKIIQTLHPGYDSEKLAEPRHHGMFNYDDMEHVCHLGMNLNGGITLSKIW